MPSNSLQKLQQAKLFIGAITKPWLHVFSKPELDAY
jgi:hypothetical protein